jgi:hypothetical protein
MDFDAYYAKEILPSISRFEKFRQDTLLKFKKTRNVLILSILVYLALLLMVVPEFVKKIYIIFRYTDHTIDIQDKFMILLAIIGIIIIAAGLHKLKRTKEEFSYLSKSQLYKKIIGFYNLDYSPFSGIDSHVVDKTNLFPNFDQFYSEDYIQGEYKGVELKLSEIELRKIVIREVGNKTIYTEEKIFGGLFIITDFHKRFSSTSYILPNKWIKISIGLPSIYKRVALEDPIFEKKFDVYSDNQIEARYILTPAFMERIMSLNKMGKIRCCFIDKQMIIALELNKDFLPELSLYEVIDKERIRKLLDELQVIFDVINTLKLDMKIGL